MTSSSYEVVEQGSPFFGKVDWAESDVDLKPGGTFIVRFNDTQENPRIEESVQEVEEDLTPYLDALRKLGKPSTAKLVADELTRAERPMTADAVRRRLDRLDSLDQVRRARDRSVGRPYVYEIVVRGA